MKRDTLHRKVSLSWSTIYRTYKIQEGLLISWKLIIYFRLSSDEKGKGKKCNRNNFLLLWRSFSFPSSSRNPGADGLKFRMALETHAVSPLGYFEKLDHWSMQRKGTHSRVKDHFQMLMPPRELWVYVTFWGNLRYSTANWKQLPLLLASSVYHCLRLSSVSLIWTLQIYFLVDFL